MMQNALTVAIWLPFGASRARSECCLAHMGLHCFNVGRLRRLFFVRLGQAKTLRSSILTRAERVKRSSFFITISRISLWAKLEGSAVQAGVRLATVHWPSVPWNQWFLSIHILTRSGSRARSWNPTDQLRWQLCVVAHWR